MPRTIIHCVRHAQGYHNLCEANHTIRDPLLTVLGEAQCATLNASFPRHAHITHIIASPLRRTLYTALLSFPSAITAGLKVVALPDLQETSDLPCDTGSDVTALAAEFADGVVDLSLVREGWNSKQGRWGSSSAAIEARARDARVFLRGLALQARAQAQAEGSQERDVEIVVVTHGGLLHYFTEDWEGTALYTGTGWANTEVRSYEFADASSGRDDDANASLVETQESREMRGVAQQGALGAEEQRALRVSAERVWTESGFQTGAEAESAKL